MSGADNKLNLAPVCCTTYLFIQFYISGEYKSILLPVAIFMAKSNTYL